MENSVIKYESGSKYADLSGENFILSAMAQNIFNAESQDLAAITQQEIMDIVINFSETEAPSMQSAFRDMLTDARHAADMLGVNFDEAVEGSLCVYHEEKIAEE